MAFQDRAESLAEKLHLSRVPRPVFAAIALAMACMIGLAIAAFSASVPGGFEVSAADVVADEAPSGKDDGQPGEGAASEDGLQGAREPDSAQGGTDVVLPSGGGSEARRVCVHVDGCVASPGVYYLAAGSRVIDAVSAAGGATAEARTEAVNLAQEIQDGQQIVIPALNEDGGGSSDGGEAALSDASRSSGSASSSSKASGMVNINTATAEEFQTLKGVGAATAEKIVADREANGPFKSIDDLTRVSGIGEKKLEAMRDRLCL